MLTAVYLVYTLALIIMAGFTIRHMASQKSTSYLWVLLAVLVGLVYDNLIIAVGRFIGEGNLLIELNRGRYIGHAFGTPLLAIFAIGVARRAGQGWAQGRTAHALICLFTTALIGLGVYYEIIRLELAPRVLLDTLRYVNVAAKGPPIPSILTVIALVVMGISLWRKSGWAWLAFGAIFMFIAAAIGTGDRIFIGNIGEVVLGLSCVLSAQKYLSTAKQ